MKNLALLILVLITALSCKNQNEAENTATIQEDKKTLIEVESLSGKTLEYNYGNYVYEISFKSENKLHWKCLKGDEKGKEATETYSRLRLNDDSLFISWVETNGLGVSQVINLKYSTVNTFLKIDNEIIPLIGTIRKL